MRKGKEIIMNLTDGAVVLVPDSTTLISSLLDHAITVPAVSTESSGTSIKKFAQILKSNFASHIHDLYSAPVSFIANKTSGTTVRFMIRAEKRGNSHGGMSPWYVCTSNGWEIRLAERVLEKSADLNQCIEALAVHAAGERFRLGTEEAAIKKSTETIKCSKKD